MPKHSTTSPPRLSPQELKASKTAILGRHKVKTQGIKYPIYKEIISEAVKGHPPHTRLPSIRDLAATLDISLVTAQRTISELIKEGRLYSRPKAGVYTSPDQSDTQAPINGESGNNPYFESTCYFATGSASEFQRGLWKDLSHAFEERYPNIRARLKFTEEPEALNRVDAYERLNWNVSPKEIETDALDLREYLPKQLADRCTPEGLLPLYFRSNFLFFNRELLEQCGLPAPTYRNFREQISYLEKSIPILEAAGLKSKPCALQQPITLLGPQHLEDFFKLASSENTDAALEHRLTKAVETVIAYCQLNERAPGFQNPKAREERVRFMDGGSAPFFLSHSVDYWLFTESPLNFEWGCYPTLTSDNSLFLWPMVGAVSNQSQKPAEGIRLLSFLVGESAQERFAQTGNFPANPDCRKAPRTNADTNWLQSTLEQSKPMRLSLRTRSYLALNIMNNELWHALLDHVPVEQATAEAIQLGRAYLRQQKLASVRNTQKA